MGLRAVSWPPHVTKDSLFQDELPEVASGLTLKMEVPSVGGWSVAAPGQVLEALSQVSLLPPAEP